MLLFVTICYKQSAPSYVKTEENLCGEFTTNEFSMFLPSHHLLRLRLELTEPHGNENIIPINNT